MSTKKISRAEEKERVKAMYADAEKAVYIALRARHEKSGLQFLAELQNAQTNDRTARNNAEISNQIDNLTAELNAHRQKMDNLRKLKAMCDRQSISVKNPDDIRRAWAKQSNIISDRIADTKNAIKILVNQIAALYDTIDISFSDRADLTQTALLQMLQNASTPAPITKTVLALYGVTTADELTDTERTDAQNAANFRAVINAVGRAINKLATPDALNRHTTKPERITTEQYNNYLNTYGTTDQNGSKTLDGIRISANRKRCRASDCYVTVEERHTKKQQGYYKITHYETIAPYQYIEDFSPTDENGENDIAYLKIYNPIVDNFGDLENLEELYNAANLTDIEQFVMEYYARALKKTDAKADIIKYICSSLKISAATAYRVIDRIKTRLEPIAKDRHII